MTLFRNKHQIESSRLSHYDYSSQGEYFITICTKDRVCHFGKIADGEMHLSAIGSIVEEEWERTAEIRTNVSLDAFVIMPNHIHGIVVIEDSLVETTGSVVSKGVGTGAVVSKGDTTGRELGCGKSSLLETTAGVGSSKGETTRRVVSTGNKPKPKTLQPNSLGSIVGQFKSVCTKRIRAAGYDDFGWQPRYYDHVIRDEQDLERIREYIVKNPSRWESDDEFAVNISMDPIHKGE